MTIEKEGAQRFKAALSTVQLRELESALGDQPRDHAGMRLSGIPELRPLLSPTGPVGHFAVSALGSECLPVRAILFDKNVDQNWSLGWHQDRTIAVRQRVDVDGFGPWSVKIGMVHVEPPFGLLAGMVTVRVHFDAVPDTNAPLLVAPGSHKRGRIPTADIPKSLVNAESSLVRQKQATSGSMQLPFFMRRRPPPRRSIAWFCRSTTHRPASWRVGMDGRLII